MKANLFFFVTLIICSQSFATLFRSKESSMEYIVNELVELNRAANIPAFKIQSVINSIAEGAASSGSAANNVFGGINTRCTRGSDRLSGFLKKLNADLLDDKARISQSQISLKSVQIDANALKAKLKSAHEGIDSLKKRYFAQITLDENVRVEAVAKIDVIKRLRDIIHDELLNSSDAGAFIQVEKFRTTLAELKEKMAKVEDTLYAPLVSALVNLASEKNFANQDILKKILSLLDKIHANLKSFIKKHKNDNKAVLKLIKEQRTLKQAQLRQLLKLSAQAAQNVKYHNALIEHAQISSALLNSQIAKKNKELEHWNTLCSAEKKFGLKVQGEIKGLQNDIKALANAASDLK